jgi:broad specificity phosphatase PhoE
LGRSKPADKPIDLKDQSMQPGITLYVVRHGETDWNAALRLQGQTDIPLNDRGRGQAARNGQALRAVLAADPSLDFVSSPLVRTTETMDIVRRELGLAPRAYPTDDRLKEIAFGVWEGKTWDDIDTFKDTNGRGRVDNPYHWQPEGGESYAQLSHRVAGWLATITRNSIVVTHGGVTRVLRGQILGLPPTKIAELAVPQDKILVLQSGGAQHSMSWL